MAQDAPTYSATPPGALSRRLREPRTPSVPRLHGVDYMWMAAFAVVSLCIGYYTGGVSILGHPESYIAAATVVLQYFLGFRVRDRATGVIASGLLATSPLFCGAAQPLRDALFIFFTIAALTAYVAEASVSAMALAACATTMHSEGIVLAAVLLGFSVTERRRGWIVGAVVYFVLTIAGMAGMLVIGHGRITVPVIHASIRPIAALFRMQTGIVALFICAMLDDLADPVRRVRWKPVMGWTVLFLCVESLVQFSDQSLDTGPFRPVLFLLAGAGIARLLPVVAGNFANPMARYAIAAVFFATLTGMRVNAELATARTLSHAATTYVSPTPRTLLLDLGTWHPSAGGWHGLASLTVPEPKLASEAATATATPTTHSKTSTTTTSSGTTTHSMRSATVHPAATVHAAATVPPHASAPVVPAPAVHTAALNPPVRTVPTTAPHAAPAPPDHASVPASHPAVATHPSPTTAPSHLATPQNDREATLQLAASLGVPTSIVSYGHHYPRKIWAIRWDIQQKQHAAALHPVHH